VCFFCIYFACCYQLITRETWGALNCSALSDIATMQFNRNKEMLSMENPVPVQVVMLGCF